MIFGVRVSKPSDTIGYIIVGGYYFFGSYFYYSAIDKYTNKDFKIKKLPNWELNFLPALCVIITSF